MLLTKVKQQIQEQALIQPGDVVLVGASGGRDSMALLHCLYHLQTALSFTVVAAHFHHGLRGVEADQDQALVAAFCQERQIPFLSTQMNIAALAKGKNIEAVGRTYRYQMCIRDSQCTASGTSIIVICSISLSKPLAPAINLALLRDPIFMASFTVIPINSHSRSFCSVPLIYLEYQKVFHSKLFLPLHDTTF